MDLYHPLVVIHKKGRFSNIYTEAFLLTVGVSTKPSRTTIITRTSYGLANRSGAGTGKKIGVLFETTEETNRKLGAEATDRRKDGRTDLPGSANAQEVDNNYLTWKEYGIQ